MVIKDGNRIVNWLCYKNMTLHDVLANWVEDYYPLDADKVSVNGRLILNEHLDCKLGFLSEKFGERIVVRVETIFPKKEKEAAQNG